MKTLLLLLVSGILAELEFRCSYIKEKRQCHSEPLCMWAKIRGPDVYYNGGLKIDACFNKSFVLQAMKTHLFPKKFTDKTNEDILRKAEIEEPESFLDSP